MLRATTWTHGRRGAAIGASAAVACLGAVLVACGSGGSGDDGYVAIGAAGGTTSRAAAEPTGSVRVVPLDGADSPGPEGSSAKSSAKSSARGTSSAPSAPRVPGGMVSLSPSAEGAKSSRTPTTSPSAASPTAGGPATPTAAPAPAALTVSEPEREATDQRWCEKVTLVFHNSGGTAVRSGTVTFGTHIIGALGVDWGTIESAVELPAPIGGGVRREKAWAVCVDAWRVPLGMHIETRDVSVRWE
jgi:hypothetical protein